MRRKWRMSLASTIGLAVLLSMLAAQCGAPAPPAPATQTVPPIVKETPTQEWVVTPTQDWVVPTPIPIWEVGQPFVPDQIIVTGHADAVQLAIQTFKYRYRSASSLIPGFGPCLTIPPTQEDAFWKDLLPKSDSDLINLEQEGRLRLGYLKQLMSEESLSDEFPGVYQYKERYDAREWGNARDRLEAMGILQSDEWVMDLYQIAPTGDPFWEDPRYSELLESINLPVLAVGEINTLAQHCSYPVSANLARWVFTGDPHTGGDSPWGEVPSVPYQRVSDDMPDYEAFRGQWAFGDSDPGGIKLITEEPSIDEFTRANVRVGVFDTSPLHELNEEKRVELGLGWVTPIDEPKEPSITPLPCYLFSIGLEYADILDTGPLAAELSEELSKQLKNHNRPALSSRAWVKVEKVEEAGNQWRIVNTGQTGQNYIIMRGNQELEVYSVFSHINHGLFVAGLIHEVAPDSKIHLYRVLNEYGRGELWTLNEALDRFIREALEDRDSGDLDGAVINLSLGYPVKLPDFWQIYGMVHGELPEGYEEIELPEGDWQEGPMNLRTQLTAAHLHGIMVVTAAGNEKARFQTPALMPETISVAANNITGTMSCFSSDGDVMAPGGQGAEPETLCYPALETCKGDCDYAVIGPVLDDNNQLNYDYWLGTSFAAPLVSGVVARVMEAKGPWPTSDLVLEELKIGDDVCPKQDPGDDPCIVNVPDAVR